MGDYGGRIRDADGQGDYLGWSLQAQTNATGAGLGTNWVIVPGSTTNTPVTFPPDADNSAVFYRLFRGP